MFLLFYILSESLSLSFLISSLYLSLYLPLYLSLSPLCLFYLCLLFPLLSTYTISKSSILLSTSLSRQRPSPIPQAPLPAATALQAPPAIPTLQIIPPASTTTTAAAAAAAFTANEMASMPRKTIYVSSSSLGGRI